MELVKNGQKQFAIEKVIWHDDPPTRENVFQVIYFREGRGEVQLDFNTFKVDGPQLFFVSEFQLFTTLSGQKMAGEVLQFANDFFCIKLNRHEVFCDAVLFNTTTHSPFISLDHAATNKIEFLIDSMQSELTDESMYQEEILTAQLKTLLLTASKLKLGQMGQVFDQRLSKVVMDFQDLLETNYIKEHSVQFYADALFISPKGLTKATKKDLGRTPGELIKEKILIEAKRELYQDVLSIKEIAFKLGFEDPAYFSRFFKKETQHSPSEFIQLASSA